MTEMTPDQNAETGPPQPPGGQRGHTPSGRLGPRPLPVYLTAATMTWLGSRLASGSSSPELPLSNQPSAVVAETAAKLAEIRGAAARIESRTEGQHSFTDAVDREISARSTQLIGGILAYRRHPYRRRGCEWPMCWSEGSTRLLDAAPGADGLPVLVIPSLINRWYVLDIEPEKSLIGYLKSRGLRPFVVDWDAPGQLERTFTLTDYVAGRLDAVLEAVITITGRKPGLLGYCMGGLLALAHADRRQSSIRSLSLMATPWDFSADAPAAAVGLPVAAPWIEASMVATGALPTDIVQSLFHALDPMLVIRKFLKFADLDQGGRAAQSFVALEDWLNDGVPLAAPVAREALFGWYTRNTPAEGGWRIAGRTVDPGRVNTPSLVLMPARDRIVPPASAEALAKRLPNVTEVRTPLGHIGMVASASARSRAWNTLGDWLVETS